MSFKLSKPLRSNRSLGYWLEMVFPWNKLYREADSLHPAATLRKSEEYLAMEEQEEKAREPQGVHLGVCSSQQTIHPIKHGHWRTFPPINHQILLTDFLEAFPFWESKVHVATIRCKCKKIPAIIIFFYREYWKHGPLKRPAFCWVDSGIFFLMNT